MVLGRGGLRLLGTPQHLWLYVGWPCHIAIVTHCCLVGPPQHLCHPLNCATQHLWLYWEWLCHFAIVTHCCLTAWDPLSIYGIFRGGCVTLPLSPSLPGRALK